MNLVVKTYKLADLPEKNQISNLYLKAEFLSLLHKYFNLDIKYLIVSNVDTEEIVAITFSVEKKILGIPSLINPQIIYYQPIEFYLPQKKYPNEKQLHELEIFKKISEYYNKYYFKVSKNLAPEIEDIRGFVWSGMSATPFYTYRFELDSYSSDNFFKKQRASLRKAQKLGYRFTQEVNINRFLELVKGTKERQEWNFNFNDEVLKSYLEDLVNLSFVEQFNIVNQEDKIVSTMFCLMDKINKISYAWLATTDVKELSNGVATQLLHSIAEHLKIDYNVFDLCGANTDSIARFKASLGTQLKVFYRIKL